MTRDRLGGWWFRLVHGTTLVFNDCREDPRIDRVALDLGPDDTVFVITSAGCNALDYALLGPRHIFAVDVNPRQNWLLELKQAGIRRLDHATFFALFGRGRLSGCRGVYHALLRPDLTPKARRYWDRAISRFAGGRPAESFYFHGPCGRFARVINFYIDHVARLRAEKEALLAAASVEEQCAVYGGRVREIFWRGPLRWLIGRDFTLALLGVPPSQRRQVERDYPGGVACFIQDALEAVATRLPLSDNYFWRLYLTGEYTPQCCPEYLKPDNFERLKAGLADRISTHTISAASFLRAHTGQISRFVLLDHMDWLSGGDGTALADEWQGIVDRATADARVLWRSGGLRTDFVDRVEVWRNGRTCRVGDILEYKRDLAARLHAQDRVHTYGSFSVATIRGRELEGRPVAC
jgi:S-adenosylmethionine-diacylglycerol 3-amino-3-carboxypropyl transferase